MIKENVMANDLKAISKDTGRKMELLIGKEVISKIGGSLLERQWNDIVEHCTWCTVFQKWEFVKTWYELYGTTFIPILILEKNEGRLTGFFPLAKDKNGWIVGAGADQAEYQGWGYESQNCDQFVREALLLLWNKISFKGIRLKYLLQGTPINSILQEQIWQKRSLIKSHRHPLLSTHSEKPSVELKKKNKREKINRLKRQGDLYFERVTDSACFAEILDDLIIQSDFRKGAAYNRELFKEDPKRKKFIQRLFDRGMLHVSLLKLDKEIIASNVGISGKKWVHLQGINTHSPFQAKHSPGILHFLMLGQSLQEEGFEVFDLTPGADPYKSGLASDFKEAYELVITHQNAIRLMNWKNTLLLRTKEKLAKWGMDESSQRKYKSDYLFLKNKLSHLIKGNPLTKLKKSILKSLTPSPILLWINPSCQESLKQEKELSLSKNCLRDLLFYDTRKEVLPKQAFLMECMKKIEEGNEVFSLVSSGELEFLAWVNHKPHSILSEELKHKINNNSCLIFDFYTRSESQKPFRSFIRAVVSKNLETSKNGDLYVLSNNKTVQDAVKELSAKSYKS